MTLSRAVLIVAMVLMPALAAGQSRLELCDKNGRREGSVRVDESGRVDVYDRGRSRLSPAVRAG